MPDADSAQEPELTDDWYILELLGHRRLAGRCREVIIAGAPMIRIDVPCDPPATQYCSAGSIYAITPTSEDVAKRLAGQSGNPAPVSRYELLPSPEVDDDGMPF